MTPLGKRSRPPSMSRITSTAELGSLCDVPSLAGGTNHDPAAPGLPHKADTASAGRGRKQRQARVHQAPRWSAENRGTCCWPPAVQAYGGGAGTPGFAAAALAALEPAQFLRACGLCNRKLGPGKDTYMYRGDMAFCSTDCRDLWIALDERGFTCSLASGVPQATAAAAAAATTTTAAAGSKATRTAA